MRECQEELAAKQALLSCLCLPVSSAAQYRGNWNAWQVDAERRSVGARRCAGLALMPFLPDGFAEDPGGQSARQVGAGVP